MLLSNASYLVCSKHPVSKNTRFPLGDALSIFLYFSYPYFCNTLYRVATNHIWSMQPGIIVWPSVCVWWLDRSGHTQHSALGVDKNMIFEYFWIPESLCRNISFILYIKNFRNYCTDVINCLDLLTWRCEQYMDASRRYDAGCSQNSGGITIFSYCVHFKTAKTSRCLA